MRTTSLIHDQAHEQLHRVLGELLPALIFIAQTSRPRLNLLLFVRYGKQRERQPVSVHQWNLETIGKPGVPKRGFARDVMTSQYDGSWLVLRNGDVQISRFNLS